VVQQRPKHTGRVKSRGAEPVNRAIFSDQRARLQIPDQAVVSDQRRMERVDTPPTQSGRVTPRRWSRS